MFLQLLELEIGVEKINIYSYRVRRTLSSAYMVCDVGSCKIVKAAQLIGRQ